MCSESLVQYHTILAEHGLSQSAVHCPRWKLFITEYAKGIICDVAVFPIKSFKAQI